MRTPERIVVGMAMVAVGSLGLELFSFQRAFETTTPQVAHLAPTRTQVGAIRGLEQAMTIEYRAPAPVVVSKKVNRRPMASKSVQQPEQIAAVVKPKGVSDEVEPEDALRIALRHKRTAFESCFNEELRKQAVFSGFVVLKLSVTADGRVTEARVQEGGRRERAVGACIASHLRGLQLPRLTSEADVILPILLEATRPAFPEALAVNEATGS